MGGYFCGCLCAHVGQFITMIMYNRSLLEGLTLPAKGKDLQLRFSLAGSGGGPSFGDAGVVEVGDVGDDLGHLHLHFAHLPLQLHALLVLVRQLLLEGSVLLRHLQLHHTTNWSTRVVGKPLGIWRTSSDQTSRRVPQHTTRSE